MRLYLILAITLVLASTTHAQYNSHDPNGQIDALLKPLIAARFDARYSYAYQVVDSMIGGFGDFEKEEIQDPYGTLKGCTVFSVSKGSDGTDITDSSYFGILKAGNIIWLSPPVFKGSFASLYATRDINNDGKVEILTTWINYYYPTVQYMWIISWDGAKGTIVNATDGNNNSVLISSVNLYQLFDANSSNIYEIRAYWPSVEDNKETGYFPDTQIITRPWVTYTWNGTLYDIAASNEQIPASAYLPANNLTVDVACKVNQITDSLQYIYTWNNSASSKQRMNLFVLSGISGFSTSHVYSDWEYIGIKRGLLANGWGPEGIDYKYTIGEGEKVKGLTLSSAALPGIIQFFIQGYRPTPDYELTNPNLVELTVNDLTNNSYKGFTVGPIVAANSFNASILVDTLISYIRQSVRLGWLAQKKDLDTSNGESAKDSIATNLIKRLQAIKTTLQQGDSVDAHTLLQNFLTKVDAEHARSTNRMSDECYALLRYNGEYLRDKLPSQ